MGLLGDYMGLPTDPNQNSAARQGLLQFGAALLGGKGNFGSILGQGIQAGAGGYNSSLQALQQKALMDAQTKHLTLGNDADQAALDQDKAIAEAAAKRNAQAPGAAASLITSTQPGNPNALSSVPQAAPTPDAGLPLSMFPQSSSGAALPVSGLPKLGAAPAASLPPVNSAPAADPFAAYTKAVADAQFYAANFPNSKAAANALKVAEALKPKVKETKAVTGPDGKTRVLANFFEDPTIPPQILQGVNPDLEKLVFRDAGGTVDGLNAYSGAVVTSAKKTESPDAIYNRGTQLAVQKAIADRQEAADKGEPEAKLQGDELRMMAAQYLAGDPSVLGNLGRGKQGAENIVAMRREITAQAKAAGMSGGDIAAKMAEFAGAKAGMRTAGTRNATIEIAASEVNQLAPIALEASANVARSGFMPFGKAQLLFDASTNDPNLRKFAMANNALVNAYGQAMARGGTATVNDKQHAEQLLSTAFDQPSYAAAVQQLMVETKAAQAAPKEVTKELSRGISGRGHDVKPVGGLPQKSKVVDFGSLK